MKAKSVKQVWSKIQEPVLNRLKYFAMTDYLNDLLQVYHDKIEYVIHRYSHHLPKHVVSSELDDLKTVARLEFIETLKVWDPVKYQSVWPLAQVRMVGAMKDHIRYITKSDPSRFYDWVSDAAHMYMVVNDRADFEHHIEAGVELNRAMKALTLRERKIVIFHTKHDLTFKVIGERLGVSESQISRIYKKAIDKIKAVLN